mmetsp:Transcript_11756/g.28488  ORF Transcript_11756/g.28488 Transcript_11756/m.28488 type:complete len:414 (-) Transcript_11756:96-1337(-)|eukprot:CAMPEP_0180144544 /NCGR_PEP_ID=MMETSP0986-20121125/17010_1 /TAXON_ID=697907 /ORGANISM="non described non described, Strain CCMP2293" /LENGTH=413 /DNA_ID=CAMNT_0022088495 /DNA_START=56 /DNA_END=1297 /DNA_ORIENTATION=+
MSLTERVQDIIKEHPKQYAEMLQKVFPTLKPGSIGGGPNRDTWLVRFLVGFKWDVKLASERWYNMTAFRDKYKIDAIRQKMEDGMKPHDFPGYLEHHKCYQCTLCLSAGRAKDGSPVNIEQTPKFDFDSLLAIPQQTSDLYLLHNIEYHAYLLDELARQTGRLHGFVKIMDLQGVTLGQVKWVRKWQAHTANRKERMQQDILECYPECFAKVFVINAPSFFSAIWRLIKPFIPPRTAEKVAVLSNKAKATEALLEYIDAATLPTFLGGKFDGEWRMLPQHSSGQGFTSPPPVVGVPVPHPPRSAIDHKIDLARLSLEQAPNAGSNGPALSQNGHAHQHHQPHHAVHHPHAHAHDHPNHHPHGSAGMHPQLPRVASAGTADSHDSHDFHCPGDLLHWGGKPPPTASRPTQGALR